MTNKIKCIEKLKWIFVFYFFKKENGKDWNFVKKQIPFHIMVKKPVEQVNKSCPSCKIPFKSGLLATYRYCEFYSLYFCTKCHDNDSYIIPSYIIQKWNFTPFVLSLSPSPLSSLPLFPSFFASPSFLFPLSLPSFSPLLFFLPTRLFLRLASLSLPLFLPFHRFPIPPCPIPHLTSLSLLSFLHILVSSNSIGVIY